MKLICYIFFAAIERQCPNYIPGYRVVTGTRQSKKDESSDLQFLSKMCPSYPYLQGYPLGGGTILLQTAARTERENAKAKLAID